MALGPSPLPLPPAAGFVRVTLSQRWLVERNQPGDFLNFAVTLVGQTPLQLPVTGLLGPSYARTQD